MKSSDRGGHRPAGVSIGRFLRYDRSAVFSADFDAVVSAIDLVHGVSMDLPDIGLVSTGTALPAERRRGDAWFTFNVGRERIEPALISVRIGASHRRLKTLHEIGHFVDVAALPGSGFSSNVAPELRAWRMAVAGSDAFRDFSQPGRGLIGEHRDRVLEALTFDEVWARSYAQFVALRSGDQSLMNEVDSLRLGLIGGVYYPLPWTLHDFGPIEAATAALFERLGWIT